MKPVVGIILVFIFAVRAKSSLKETVQSSTKMTGPGKRSSRKLGLLDMFQEDKIKEIHSLKKQVAEQKSLLSYYRGRLTRECARPQETV